MTSARTARSSSTKALRSGLGRCSGWPPNHRPSAPAASAQHRAMEGVRIQGTGTRLVTDPPAGEHGVATLEHPDELQVHRLYQLASGHDRDRGLPAQEL